MKQEMMKNVAKKCEKLNKKRLSKSKTYFVWK